MNQLNGSVLAYIGDAVLSLQVREHLIKKGITKSKVLLRESIDYVSATGQANFLNYLLNLELLSEDERAIYRRGRNHKSQSIAKNADVVTYRIATGLEALWGYLYLEEKRERLSELFDLFVEFVEKQ